MPRRPRQTADASGEAMPMIDIPPHESPSAEELRRRAAHFERVMRLRKEIGPIGISMIDVVRRFRDGGDDGRWQEEGRESNMQQHT